MQGVMYRSMLARASVIVALTPILFATSLVVSCQSPEETEPERTAVEAGADGNAADSATAGDSRAGGEGSPADARDGDATSDEGSSGCDYGCHWDCSAGFQCWSDGHVWQIGLGAYPCCRIGEPWPFEGPTCGAGDVLTCTAGCGTSMWQVDSRYAYCLQSMRLDVSPLAMVRLLCAEGAPHVSGDPCLTDDDCRPAAASVTGGLSCDVRSGTCTDVSRPAAPPEFGASCGLMPSDVPTDPDDRVVAGKTCSYCHVVRGTDCVEQACTMPCEYDEDCPDGAVCLCETTGRGALQQFCAKVTTREGSERTAWLSCP